jgi:hypothetical protein
VGVFGGPPTPSHLPWRLHHRICIEPATPVVVPSSTRHRASSRLPPSHNSRATEQVVAAPYPSLPCVCGGESVRQAGEPTRGEVHAAAIRQCWASIGRHGSSIRRRGSLILATFLASHAARERSFMHCCARSGDDNESDWGRREKWRGGGW